MKILAGAFAGTLSNAMDTQPLSFQSLTSEDVESMPPRVEVAATVRMHPKDRAKLERLASCMSMERGVSSLSWNSGGSGDRGKKGGAVLVMMAGSMPMGDAACVSRLANRSLG